MNNSLRVLIKDSNIYQLAGLYHLIVEHYDAQGISVRFTQDCPTVPNVDLIFHAVDYGSIDQVCHYFSPDKPPPVVFVIRDNHDYLCPPPLRCTRKSGTLYRDQPLDEVLTLISAAMDDRRLIPAKPPPLCGPCEDNLLTARECEVLRYLKRGNSQVQTAEQMRIQVKTVNSHKRSAMKKLNFTRNNELLNWMLRGAFLPLTDEPIR